MIALADDDEDIDDNSSKKYEWIPLIVFPTWNSYVLNSGIYEKDDASSNSKSDVVKVLRKNIENNHNFDSVKKIKPENLSYQSSDIVYKKWIANYINNSRINSTENIEEIKILQIKDIDEIKLTDEEKNLIYEINQKILPDSDVKDLYVISIPIHFVYSQKPYSIEIKPQYEMLDYDKNGKIAHEYYGLLKNVGTIRRIKLLTSGLMFNQFVNVVLKDKNGNLIRYPLGVVQNKKWTELIWENKYNQADIIPNIDDKRPLYPRELPYYKFYSLEISVSPQQKSKNAFLILHSISMQYDLFFRSDEEDPDGIEDDRIWMEVDPKDRKAYGLEEQIGISKYRYLLENWQNRLMKHYWALYNGTVDIPYER